MDMKNHRWLAYVFWIALVEGVGALSGWLTREGVEVYTRDIIKPALSPPAWVFPVVWVALFALLGIGVARVYLAPPSAARNRSLGLFWVQLAFNFAWSILFFNLQRFGFALGWLVVLWGLILWMTLSFHKTDTASAWLQVPYLLWVAFAAYLNFEVWMLNSLG